MNPVVFIIFDMSLNHDFFWNWVFHEKIIKNCWGYLEKQTHFLILSQNHCFSLYHQPFLMKKIRKNRFHQISRFRDRSNIIKSLGFIFYAKRMVLNVRKKMHKGFRVVSDLTVNLYCEEQDSSILLISASRISEFSSICWRLQRARSRRSVGVRQ